jgi:Small-conductance mechanosensitive channel
MEDLLDNFRLSLLARGFSEDTATACTTAVALVALLFLAWLVNLVAKQVILRVLKRIVASTRFRWDDAMLEAGVFTRLSHLAPAVVINALGPAALGGSPAVLSGVSTVVNLYLIVISLSVVYALLNALHALSEERGQAKEVPIKGFIQAIKLIATLVGVIFGLAILLNKTPLYLLSGLGALTAVLLLVFRDAILGFVAGIMISVNKMVRIGDWIEMDKAGADGFVIDVSLTTVKVQNWDKTITTIPSYDLISHSFKNWRGMFETGGRRIKRSIFIDMQSIRFADEAMLERWKKIGHVRQHLERKLAEIAEDNKRLGDDANVLGNGRRLTNIGTFRAYVTSYLRSHPGIHQDMIFLIRQLQPTAQGLPLEIYVFTRDTAWVLHEGVQADIFDHLLSVISIFDLRVYQQPSGYDLRSLALGLTPSAPQSASTSS